MYDHKAFNGTTTITQAIEVCRIEPCDISNCCPQNPHNIAKFITGEDVLLPIYHGNV